MVKRVSLVLSSAIAVAGCVEPELELSSTSQAARCTPAFCMSNSPVIGVYKSFSFRTDYQPNAEGLRIIAFSKGTDFYKLEVKDSGIVGLDASGAPKLTGYDLQGAKIWMNGPNNEQYAIEIEGWGRMEDVVSTNELDTYILRWDLAYQNQIPDVVVAGGYPPEGMPALRVGQAVCPEPPGGPEYFNEWNESRTMDPYQSLVFEGDVIDAEKRTIDPMPDDKQFNIGCASHTLAKLRLTRNTIHTAASWQRAQAALKMLSADYCGTGEPYTIAGQPIVWMDRAGMDHFWSTPTDLEARWNENGATCLNTPRMVKRSTVKCANGTFGMTRRHQTLDYCQNSDLVFDRGDLVISGNHY